MKASLHPQEPGSDTKLMGGGLADLLGFPSLAWDAPASHWHSLENPCGCGIADRESWEEGAGEDVDCLPLFFCFFCFLFFFCFFPVL
ncbi:hypothetical protein PRUPE_7G034900 [Prunus persica]|uniref:Uncharacterized protein n=1 Tax=Prunus persica TaxID=3760 RepID=A0A251N691_PRUPE|nr:hypothetical protein PRUPE_7G034900 [Prunus persica]